MDEERKAHYEQPLRLDDEVVGLLKAAYEMNVQKYSGKPSRKKGSNVAEFKTIVPVLKVANMQRAVDFYTGVLGFTVCWRAANDGGGENCMMGADATNLLLSTGSHLGDQPQFTGTLYFHMAGVREFFERGKNQVEFVWPLERMEYGQTEFGIKDCDGYTLAFSEPIEEK